MLISRDPEGPRLQVDTPPQFIWHYAAAEENPATGACPLLPCPDGLFPILAYDPVHQPRGRRQGGSKT